MPARPAPDAGARAPDPKRRDEKKDLEMSGENDARFDVGELADRIRDLRGRFDEFRGRL